MQPSAPIGVFDSGYGGLTILKELVNALPQYDYLYLGDNARAPYGTRSFETVYQYTLEAVEWFFEQGCELVILACNTASAKALRSIQQKDLPKMNDHSKRVLGVIRPTSEIIGQFTQTKKIGILATNGTVQSNSYPIEIKKTYNETTLSTMINMIKSLFLLLLFTLFCFFINSHFLLSFLLSLYFFYF